jgi:uncharacterized repeat protein (TIGR03803 family)
MNSRIILRVIYRGVVTTMTCKHFRLRATLLMFLFPWVSFYASGQIQGSVLYDFDECAHPAAPLTVDAKGNLYGIASRGGTEKNGCVFAVSRSGNRWVEHTIWDLGGVGGGGGFLTFDSAGNLYGTWAGTVFRLSPTAGGRWNGTVLHNFVNWNGGLDPQGGLVFDAEGNLYGTTGYGGEGGGGTVFELSPVENDWKGTLLYSFPGSIAGPDGDSPVGGLVSDRDGNLYGVTKLGGANGYGAVFELARQSGGGYEEEIIFSFNLSDGYQPTSGLAIDQLGNLYGTTSAGGDVNICYYVGCGIVFQLTKDRNGSWNENVLHEMNGSDGTYAVGPVAFDSLGNLYAAAESGGILGMGSIFMLAPTQTGEWAETMLHRFDFKFPNGEDGESPYAGVTVVDGKVFGTTILGGVNDEGILFEITPPQGDSSGAVNVNVQE